MAGLVLPMLPPAGARSRRDFSRSARGSAGTVSAHVLWGAIVFRDNTPRPAEKGGMGRQDEACGTDG
ncbi:MAG: hypothetical protein NZL87_03235, partial [Thermomicrobium sp.]|nr:hypothetical protein [Thermomicrobium sp.]